MSSKINEFDLAKLRKMMRQKDMSLDDEIINYFLHNLEKINGPQGSKIRRKDWRKFTEKLLPNADNLLKRSDNWNRIFKIIHCKYLLENWSTDENTKIASVLNKYADKNQKLMIINLFQKKRKQDCLPSELKIMKEKLKHEKFQEKIHKTFKEYQSHKNKKNNFDSNFAKILVQCITHDCLERITQNNNEKRNEFYYILEEYDQQKEYFRISMKKVLDRHELQIQKDFKDQNKLLKKILDKKLEDVDEITCELIAYLENTTDQEFEFLNNTLVSKRVAHEYKKLSKEQKSNVNEYLVDIKKIMTERKAGLRNPKVKKLKSFLMYRYKPNNRVESIWFRIIFEKNDKNLVRIAYILKRDESTYKRIKK